MSKTKKRKGRESSWKDIQRSTKAAHYRWKTRDGKVLTPKEFTDSHLANSLRLLQRKAVMNRTEEDRSWRVEHSPLLDEAHRRGLEWEVPHDAQCEWSGPDGGCVLRAVMLTADKPAVALCEGHRPERFTDVPCAGCFKPRQIVAQAGESFYCAECMTPLSWWAFLLVYLNVLFGRRPW